VEKLNYTKLSEKEIKNLKKVIYFLKFTQEKRITKN
jgi:hypothetical protein